MSKQTVPISGIWLRKSGGSDNTPGKAQVLVEMDGQWLLVIEETESGNYSHITEPLGILTSRPDPWGDRVSRVREELDRENP